MLGVKSKNFIVSIISTIIQRYFASLHTVIITYNGTHFGPIENNFLDGVTEGVKRLSERNQIFVSWINVAPLSSNEFQEILLKNVDIGTQGYISILSDTPLFISIKYNASQSSVLRQRDKVLLMLSRSENPKTVLSTTKLYLYPQNLFIVTRNESSLELWTQKYIGKSGNKQPVLLNKFDSSRRSTDIESLYPEKLKNLHQRRVKIASITYLPYMEVFVKNKGKGNVLNLKTKTKDIFYDGAEARLIMEFCARKNCVIEVNSYGIDNWGGFYENGSSDGMIGSIYRQETELAIGCNYNWFHDKFDASQHIAESSVTILTPEPLPVQPYEAIIMPFSYTAWSVIFASVVISSMVLFLLEKYEIHPRISQKRKGRGLMISSLHVLAIFFQQPFPSQKIKKRAIRLWIGVLLIGTLILENSYTGKLKSLLTVPQYTEPIDTVLKFVESELNWSAPSDLWVATISKSNIRNEQILHSKFKSKSHAELRNLTFSRNYGFGIERLHSGLFSFGGYIKPDALKNFIVLKDYVYFDYTRVLAIRGWPLMTSLNEFIQQTLEYGLWTAWEKQSVRKYLDSKTEEILISLATSPQYTYVPTILNLGHVSGIFFILIFGYVIAFTSLFCEIIIHFTSKRKIKV